MAERTHTVMVYLDQDGNNPDLYAVRCEAAGREYAHRIVTQGYHRTTGEGELTYYPPHRIFKVRIVDHKHWPNDVKKPETESDN